MTLVAVATRARRPTKGLWRLQRHVPHGAERRAPRDGPTLLLGRGSSVWPICASGPPSGIQRPYGEGPWRCYRIACSRRRTSVPPRTRTERASPVVSPCPTPGRRRSARRGDPSPAGPFLQPASPGASVLGEPGRRGRRHPPWVVPRTEAARRLLDGRPRIPSALRAPRSQPLPRTAARGSPAATTRASRETPTTRRTPLVLPCSVRPLRRADDRASRDGREGRVHAKRRPPRPWCPKRGRRVRSPVPRWRPRGAGQHRLRVLEDPAAVAVDRRQHADPQRHGRGPLFPGFRRTR